MRKAVAGRTIDAAGATTNGIAGQAGPRVDVVLAGRLRHAIARSIPTLAVLLVLAGSVFNGLDSSAGSAVSGALGGVLLLVACLAIRPRTIVWTELTPILGIGALALAWATAASIGWLGAPAVVPDLALVGMLGVAGASSMLIAGAMIGATRPSLDPILDRLAGGGAVVAALGLIVAQTPGIVSDSMWQAGQGGRFAGTFGNANVAATFYAAIAAISFARILASSSSVRSAKPARRADLALTARWLGLVILIAACVATASRTGMATLIAAMAGLLVMRRRTSRRRIGRPATIAILAAMMVVVLMLMVSDRLFERFGSVSEDWSVRRAMWSHYSDVAAASPWLGYGLGSFPSVNLHTIESPWMAQALWTTNSAHNVLLQLTIDAGLPFLGLVSTIVGWIAVRVATLTRRGRAPDIGGAIAATLVIAANAMVDIALDVPTIILLFWLLLGLMLGCAIGRARQRPLPGLVVQN